MPEVRPYPVGDFVEHPIEAIGRPALRGTELGPGREDQALHIHLMAPTTGNHPDGDDAVAIHRDVTSLGVVSDVICLKNSVEKPITDQIPAWRASPARTSEPSEYQPPRNAGSEVIASISAWT